MDISINFIPASIPFPVVSSFAKSLRTVSVLAAVLFLRDKNSETAVFP